MELIKAEKFYTPFKEAGGTGLCKKPRHATAFRAQKNGSMSTIGESSEN